MSATVTVVAFAHEGTEDKLCGEQNRFFLHVLSAPPPKIEANSNFLHAGAVAQPAGLRSFLIYFGNPGCKSPHDCQSALPMLNKRTRGQKNVIAQSLHLVGR